MGRFLLVVLLGSAVAAVGQAPGRSGSPSQLCPMPPGAVSPMPSPDWSCVFGPSKPLTIPLPAPRMPFSAMVDPRFAMPFGTQIDPKIDPELGTPFGAQIDPKFVMRPPQSSIGSLAPAQPVNPKMYPNLKLQRIPNVFPELRVQPIPKEYRELQLIRKGAELAAK